MKSSHEVWSAPGPDNVRLGCHMLCVNLPTPDPCCCLGHALAQYSHLPPMKPSLRAHRCFL